MTHHPIFVKDITLSFGEKVCFEDFSAAIYAGRRIAVTGSNGQGKSLLLKIIQGLFEPTRGTVHIPEGLSFAYVPQMVEGFLELSGAERFLRALSRALAARPDILCLDEPTNHLDAKNRRALFAMLENLKSTLLIISHDRALLRCNFDIIWHLEEGKIHQFSGSFDDFEKKLQAHYQACGHRKQQLRRESAQNHCDLMREQQRAKKKKAHGEKKYDGDKLALRSAQGRGQLTANKNRKYLAQESRVIHAELSGLSLPETLRPNFAINASIRANKPVLSIVEGSCGYDKPLLTNITLQIAPGEALAIIGPNGSGKSTLAKAILAQPHIKRSGQWTTPSKEQIGYLDQHYATLDEQLSPWEAILKETSKWSNTECREHLNNFLFRKNEQIHTKIQFLSGGEKARLSLALIAVKTPSLLIVDEITNNLDMRTREHVIEILKAYPGALLAISHDEDFLQAIAASNGYVCFKEFY